MSIIAQVYSISSFNESEPCLNFFDKVLFIFIKTIKSVSTYLLDNGKKLFGLSSRAMIYASTYLWDWKWQAIYLRIEIWFSQISKSFETRQMKSKILHQSQLIDKLQHDLKIARIDITELRSELLKGYEFQIETASQHSAIKKQLDSEQLSTHKLKLIQDIHSHEQELVELLKSLDVLLKVSKSLDEDKAVSYLVNRIIPSWQTHMQKLIEVLDNLIEKSPDSVCGKRLMIQISELAKRPLAFTELVMKLHSLQKISHTVEELPQPNDPEIVECDPVLLHAIDDLEKLLKTKL